MKNYIKFLGDNINLHFENESVKRMGNLKDIYIYDCNQYDAGKIAKIISPHISAKEGQSVVIKPNWVTHPLGTLEEWSAVTTNSAIIEAVLINLYSVMNGRGTITICDSPTLDANMKKIKALNGIEGIIEKYRTDSFSIRILDLRKYYYKTVKNWLVSLETLSGDESVDIVMEEDSMFYGKPRQVYEVYGDIDKATQAHKDEKHHYSIAKSVIDCDVFINLPKLKTHRKAGITCAMKNLVGIVSDKFCIPHRTVGTVSQGGDSPDSNERAHFSTESSFIIKVARKIEATVNPWVRYPLLPAYLIYSTVFHHALSKIAGYDGSWHGNDTIWRAVMDLNRILFYCDKKGNFTTTIQRKYICIVDAIIAGEGQGPRTPTPKRCNYILVGMNPVSTDVAAATIMGFDWKKVHYLRAAFDDGKKLKLIDGNPEEIQFIHNGQMYNLNSEQISDIKVQPPFVPSDGWKNYIEAK